MLDHLELDEKLDRVESLLAIQKKIQELVKLWRKYNTYETDLNADGEHISKHVYERACINEQIENLVDPYATSASSYHGTIFLDAEIARDELKERIRIEDEDESSDSSDTITEVE